MFLKRRYAARLIFTVLVISITGVLGLPRTRKASQDKTAEAIGTGVVWRTSNQRDQHANAIPPWKEIRIANVFGFKVRPATGEKVTVIPLDVSLSSQNLAVVKTRRGANCDESAKDVWWEIDLEPIKQKEYFEISPMPNRRGEYPFDVAVIYPAVKSARQIRRNELRKNSLPARVSIETVKAAIDITNDGTPDFLIVEYCCENERTAEGCDYTCGKTFQRVGNKWKLIDKSSPC